MQLSFILEFKIKSGCPTCAGVVSSVLLLSDGIRKRSGWSNTICCWCWEAMSSFFFLPNRGGIIFQVGSFPFNLSFPFHQDNHCFAVVPLNRSWKRPGKGTSAGRYDCTATQCYHPDTVLSNIWRKSFCTIFDCLLGCEAAVGRLTTWWAALKYTLRIKLFIQDGDMYPACLRLWRRFRLLQLSFTGHSFSFIPLHGNTDFSQKSKFFVDRT